MQYSTNGKGYDWWQLTASDSVFFFFF